MLSESVSYAQLSNYAEWGLVVFVVVFVGIVIHTILQPKDKINEIANIPIDDDPNSANPRHATKVGDSHE